MGGPGPPLMPPGPLGNCCILMSLGGCQKKKKKKITQIHRLHENVIIGYTHSWKFKQTADHFQGNANIGARHITADMKSRFMDSLMYRKQPLTLIIKSSLQVFILE